MANNYTSATVEPTFPEGLLTSDELELLGECGFHLDIHDNELYFYVEDGVWDEHDWVGIFQNAILRSNGEIKEVVVNAAEYCSKMRPGEFGGWVTYITKDKYWCGSTYGLLTKFRKQSKETPFDKKISFITSVLNIAEEDNNVFTDSNSNDAEGLKECKKHAKKIQVAKRLLESLME